MINVLLPYHDRCQQYNRFLRERAYTRNVIILAITRVILSLQEMVGTFIV